MSPHLAKRGSRQCWCQPVTPCAHTVPPEDSVPCPGPVSTLLPHANLPSRSALSMDLVPPLAIVSSATVDVGR